MVMRIVVADERSASFIDTYALNAPYELRATVLNDNAGLKDRDLETDRAGRGSNAGGIRHGMDGERSTHRHLVESFARNVAMHIDESRKRHEFEQLVLIAGPRMLGLIRNGLPVPCKAMVVAE